MRNGLELGENYSICWRANGNNDKNRLLASSPLCKGFRVLLQASIISVLLLYWCQNLTHGIEQYTEF
jgi:hypothetical protein